MTPHPSVLNTLPYKNKQDYKGGTNAKTHDSHTCETSVSRSDHDSCTRNLYAENENKEDDEYIEPPSIKNYKIDSQSHEETRKILLFKIFIKSN